MAVEPGSSEHLTELISHVVAPAFLLSAVGSYVSILSDRLTGVVQRIDQLGGHDPVSNPDEKTKSIVQRLRRRAELINIAILFGVISGAVAVLLIIGTFTAALSGAHHVWIAAALFILSGAFLLCSLVAFGIDVKRGLSAHDLH